MAANATLDKGDVPSADETVFRTFKLSVYSSVFVLSMTGNMILICAIFKFRKLRTVPNFLVLNLSICDLLVVISSIPFQMAYEELGYFPYGPVGCKVLWPLATCGINAGVLTLVAIAVERYKAINSPMTFQFKKWRVIIMILATHLVGICSVIPYSLCLKFSHADVDCSEIWSRKSRQIYTLILFLMQYAVPLPVIVTLYSLSWNKVRHQNMETIRIAERGNHRKKNRNSDKYRKLNRTVGTRKSLVRSDSSVGKRISELKESFRRPDPLCEVALQRYEQTMRTLKMFIAVIVVFAVCALPNQITWLWTDFSDSGGPSNLVSTIFYFLTYTNSVFNPWIYGGFNPSFRKAYKTMIYDQGIVRLYRILLCLSSDERNPDLLLNSRTEFSGVYRLKNTDVCYTENLHVPKITNNGSERSSKQIFLSPNLCEQGERPASSYETTFRIDFTESLRKNDSGYGSGDTANIHDTIKDNIKCTSLEGHDERIQNSSVDRKEKQARTTIKEIFLQPSPKLLRVKENNEKASSLISLSISDTSSTSSLRRVTRHVSFVDSPRSPSCDDAPHGETEEKSQFQFGSYEDIPYSVDIDLLTSVRETDC